MPRAPHEDDPRVLTPEAFELLLANELRRAMRSQNFLTLVLLDATGPSGDPVREVARAISDDVRETDVIARTEDRHLALVLLDADMNGSRRVIDRLLIRLEEHGFQEPVEIAVGAACCPTDATDVTGLWRHAAQTPIATRRAGPRAPNAGHTS
jgi:Diguanylate cyclase, GGDEF domain